MAKKSYQKSQSVSCLGIYEKKIAKHPKESVNSLKGVQRVKNRVKFGKG